MIQLAGAPCPGELLAQPNLIAHAVVIGDLSLSLIDSPSGADAVQLVTPSAPRSPTL